MAESGTPLPEIKRLSDEYEFLHYAARGLFHAWTGLESDNLAGQKVRHSLFLLRIGHAVVAGLPGEPFGHFSTRLREETIGDRLVVAEQANGYLGYIPTAQEFALGSYEPNCSLFAPESEDVIVGAARSAILSLAGQ